MLMHYNAGPDPGPLYLDPDQVSTGKKCKRTIFYKIYNRDIFTNVMENLDYIPLFVTIIILLTFVTPSQLFF